MLTVLLSVFSFFALNATTGNAQIHAIDMSKETQNNPLLCDPVKGVCEIPDSLAAGNTVAPAPEQKPIRIVYFTDPICSSCWGIEPQLRKLKLEYGDCIEIEYHMGGLLPSWDIYNSGGISKPSDVAHHWDEVSAYYDMPIDGDVWLEDPLPSSYPPSVAFKAAQMQNNSKALLFLRAIREMVFLKKKNITKWEHLSNAAIHVGLDAAQLRADMEGKAQELFQQDLQLAKQVGVRGFPTLLFSTGTSNQTLYGFKAYAEFEKLILQLHPTAEKRTVDTAWQSVFLHYPTVTAQEFALLTNRTKEEAELFLNNLYDQHAIDRLATKNGSLWEWKEKH